MVGDELRKILARQFAPVAGLRGAMLTSTHSCAPVAQLDRASGYEPEGREFESPRAHHFLQEKPDITGRAFSAMSWACTTTGHHASCEAAKFWQTLIRDSWDGCPGVSMASVQNF